MYEQNPSGPLLRFARAHVVNPRFRGTRPLADFVGREEERNLPLGGLRTVAPVNQVERVAYAEVTPNGSRGCLAPEGGAHHVPADGDGSASSDREHDDRRTCHESHQSWVECLLPVCLIVSGREILRNPHHLASDDLQSLVFETGDDSPDQPALDGVGFQDDERGLHARNTPCAA
jgi:hypothetical protein